MKTTRFMKLSSPFLCLTTALFIALPLEAQSQAPQFASLTPGTSPSGAGWIRDLNAMSEEERQRRVRTYGTPPTAPQARRPAPAPQGSHAQRTTRTSANAEHPSGQSRPQARPQQARPRVIEATVKKPMPRTKRGDRSTGAGSASAPARATAVSRPARSAQSVVPKSVQGQRTTPVFSQPAPQRRSAAPSRNTRRARPSAPPIPQAAAERQAELRRQVAFMPSNHSARLKSPWAPYESRAEYQRALARTQWQPRGAVAEKLAKQQAKAKQQARAKPKRRWSLASLFKKKSSPPPAKKRRSSRGSAPAPASRKLPNSKHVTAGLPQPDRSSETMIDTTLFGG